jgi:oligosaccharide repeat unit polymerase
MSEILAIVTTIILVFVAFELWRTYKIKVFLHPGLYFCVLWAFGVLSHLILSIIQNQSNLYNVDCVDELNGYVLYTSVLFYVFRTLGRKKVLSKPSVWKIYPFYPLFKYIAIASLIAAVSMFFIRGATLDFSATRDATVELETALYYGEVSQSILFTVLGVFISSNIILGVFAGFMIAECFGKRKNITVNLWLLILPLFTQIVMMLTVGGRIDFINILRAYIFGVSISIANGINKAFMKKVVIVLSSAFMLFSVYSNFNYQQRTSESLAQDSNPVLNKFSSIMEYYSSVYTGYQLRRYDYVTNELEYGEKTFAGVLFFQIPLAGTIGLKNSSVGEFFGLEEYSMKKMFLDLQSQNALHFSTVSSIFLLFYDDYGYWGTFIFLFILVWVTQLVYVFWFNSVHKSFFSIYIMFLFFVLWSNSIMDPVFSTGFLRSCLLSIATLQLVYFVRYKIIRSSNIKIKASNG